MKLYKYRSTSEYALKGLEDNQIYLSSFEEFNDPFEFSNPITDQSEYNRRARIEIEKLYQNGTFTTAIYHHLISAVPEPEGIIKYIRNQKVNHINSGLPNIGVFSLSELNNEILMWSHYAQDHKGFCIEFKELESLLEIDVDIFKVQYIDQFHDLNDPKLLIESYIELFSKKYHLPEKNGGLFQVKLPVQ